LSAGELIVNLHKRLAQVLLAGRKDKEGLTMLELARGRAIARELNDRFGLSEDASASVLPAPDSGEYAKRVGATVVSYSLFAQFDGDLLHGFDDDWVPVVQIAIAVSSPDGRTTLRNVDLSQNPLELGRLVQDGRRAMGMRGRGESSPASIEAASSEWLRQLYRILIHPIEDLLPASPDAGVAIIPQQLLFLVPFAALEDSNGVALVEKHTLWFLPSLRTAEASRTSGIKRSTESPGTAVVVGNPTMPVLSDQRPSQMRFPSLPGAQREAVAIATMLGTRALLRDEPDRDTVLNLLPAATIVHLATHALSDDLNGLSGVIVLAPKGNRSPYLTVQDVLMTGLVADLVVLSACNTGRGRITADGTVGLVSSFLSAGAATVVASLWRVSDDSTTFLMSEFYRNLQLGVQKATALRTAMLATKRRFSSPTHWAPFVLFGDASMAMRAPNWGGLQRARANGMNGIDCSSLSGRAIPLPVDRGQIRGLLEMPSSIVPGRRDTYYAIDLGNVEIFDFYREVLAPYGFHRVVTTGQTTTGPWHSLYFECSSGPIVSVDVTRGTSSDGAVVFVHWLAGIPSHLGSGR
jgi:CHAT domain-containing protein